ncbi:hypothetical protein ABMC88_17490 [Sulfitobacter sp. HNIBRBA2951]|uniref:hypothetical protein n=1 Tax=Sulfitobacter aquimarinus TaxID=3158557 RepID=UPI0032DFF71E
MNSENVIDPEVLDAIADALRKRGLEDTPYARKFEKRIVNKLVGQFHESDLLDLINDMPNEE